MPTVTPDEPQIYGTGGPYRPNRRLSTYQVMVAALSTAAAYGAWWYTDGDALITAYVLATAPLILKKWTRP
ncbi:hypothetical protein ACFQO7_22760 [Catellatospora aurea]|uniref:Uncharacterized protein n=1 Tax=Catellatospora aurea TaxID=1337874 RepID=A0ABW2H251_9ACTN